MRFGLIVEIDGQDLKTVARTPPPTFVLYTRGRVVSAGIVLATWATITMLTILFRYQWEVVMMSVIYALPAQLAIYKKMQNIPIIGMAVFFRS